MNKSKMTNHNSNDLPSRPRFQWDMRSPPWTDGRGPQHDFVKNVKLWKEFHAALPDSNSNKVPKSLQGIILKSQHYHRASDLGSKVSDEELRFPDGALTLAAAVHKIDGLSQVTRMAENFHRLLTTKRWNEESHLSF